MKDEKLPPSIGEVTDLFFGPDDKKNLGLSDPGRLKKEEDEIDSPEQRVKKPKGSKHSRKQKKLEEKALIKQANFLKRFEEKLKKREEAEKQQKLERSEKYKISQLVNAKRADKKKKIRPKAIQAMNGSEKDLTNCSHEDVFSHIEGPLIVSVCRHCSRQHKWQKHEWDYYTLKYLGKSKEGNPDLETIKI